MLRRFSPLFLVWLALLSGCATSEIGVFNVHTVQPGVLVRGGQPKNEDEFREILETYDVRTVVNLNDATAAEEEAVVTGLGMNYLALPSNAFDPDRDHLLAFLRVMRDESLHPVYVHCRQGMDRAGTAVGLYRILFQGWDADAAVDELHRYQEPLNDLVFLGVIPPYLRAAAAAREAWLAALDATDPPAVVRADPRPADGAVASSETEGSTAVVEEPTTGGAERALD